MNEKYNIKENGDTGVLPQTEDKDEIKKIVNKWTPIKNKDDRVKYIANFYMNSMNIEKKVPSIDEKDRH